jgi:transposase
MALHLKNRMGELFDLEYDLLMYDVTSTFFEGRADFPLAQRGYSRDQRSDCIQVCIALVVSKCGMPLGYEIFAGNKVTKTDTGGARIEWSKIEAHRDWATLSAGCYLLRPNVADWSNEDLWKAYIQLTEAEAAFRIHKSDLSLRPIWHQKEDRVLAHIFVCFVAYVLWKTLGQICMKAGLGNEPRRVLAELSDIRSMDVVHPTRSGPEIRTRCISKPTEHQQILLEKLGLKLPAKIIQRKM